MALSFVEEKGVCDAKLAISRNGPRGFEVTWKKDGKGMYKSTVTVSDDDKTLTEKGSAVGTNETTTIVYDHQP